MVSNTTQPSSAHFLPTSPHRVCFIVRPILDDSSNYNLQQAKRDLLTWYRLNSELCTGVTALFCHNHHVLQIRPLSSLKTRSFAKEAYSLVPARISHSSKTEKSYVQNCVLKKYFNH